MKGDTVLSCFSNHHCMNEIEYFLLFLRGREAQLVSVGLKETGDVQVSEAIRQVYNFEHFLILFPTNLLSGSKSLCCLPGAWMNDKIQLWRQCLLSHFERCFVRLKHG